MLTDQTREHLAHLDDDGVQLNHARLQNLHPAERQQLARHGNGAARRFLNLLHTTPMKIVRAFTVDQEIAVAPDYREQIVEIVRHAARESAHGFHLVGLTKPLLKLPMLVLSLLHIGTHPNECAGDFRDFIATAAFEQVIKIALLQSANARYQTRERPRKRMRNQEHERAAGQHTQQS